MGRNFFYAMLRDFLDAGYSFHYKILRAEQYGVPQSRERMILIASWSPPHSFPTNPQSRTTPSLVPGPKSRSPPSDTVHLHPQRNFAYPPHRPTPHSPSLPPSPTEHPEPTPPLPRDSHGQFQHRTHPSLRDAILHETRDGALSDV
jgi:site-specific DNA-cytosine methylase